MYKYYNHDNNGSLMTTMVHLQLCPLDKINFDVS